MDEGYKKQKLKKGVPISTETIVEPSEMDVEILDGKKTEKYISQSWIIYYLIFCYLRCGYWICQWTVYSSIAERRHETARTTSTTWRFGWSRKFISTIYGNLILKKIIYIHFWPNVNFKSKCKFSSKKRVQRHLRHPFRIWSMLRSIF